MEIREFSGFVKSFDKDKAIVYLYEINQVRSYDMNPFFIGVKMHRGLNISIVVKSGPGFIETTCNVKPYSKVKHLWNYYIKKKH